MDRTATAGHLDDALEEGHDRLERGPAACASTGLLGGGSTSCSASSRSRSRRPPSTRSFRASSRTCSDRCLRPGLSRSSSSGARSSSRRTSYPGRGRRGRARDAVAAARLWLLTFAGNVAALLVLAALLSVEGDLDPETLKAAGDLADTLGERALLPSFISAVIAGVVMTLFTWLVIAAERDSTRVLLALLIGFLLAAPSLNHAVVGVGEMAFGLFAGTTDIGWADAGQTLVTAIAGNLVGGLGFVTVTRLFQVSGQEGPLGN
jgi:hypothetical protein